MNSSDRIDRGGILAVEGEILDGCIDRARAPGRRGERFFETVGGRDIVGARDCRLILADAGDQGQLLGDRQPVLGEQRVLVGHAAKAGNGGVRAVEYARNEIVRIDGRRAAKRRIVGMGKIDAVDVEAGDELVDHAENVPAEFCVHAVAELLLVVKDLDVAASVDQAGGGIVGVTFDVLPVSLGVQIVKRVLKRDAVGDLPFGLHLVPAILVADVAVADVVIFEA